MFITLSITAFFSAILTTSLGLGGGVVLLAVMSLYMPPAILIPVHGAAHLGSNAGRLLFFWHHIPWRIVMPFCVGSIIGAVLGRNFVVALPEATLNLTLAIAILLFTWMPTSRLKLERLHGNPKFYTPLGVVTGFLNLFIGITGPIFSVFLQREILSKKQIVAAMSLGIGLQHATKLVVFSTLGFDFTDHLPLIAAMVASGMGGVIVGKSLLHRLPEALFRKILRIITTLLALRLLWRGVELWVG